MNFHDLFRGFFGFPPHTDHQSDIFTDFFGPPSDSLMDDGEDNHDPGAVFRRPSFEHFGDFAEHFGRASDGFFGSMDKLFEKFFSDFAFNMDIPLQVPPETESTLSPRDRMLKRPDSGGDLFQQQPFTGWHKPEGNSIHKDVDLDDQVTPGNLDSILPCEKGIRPKLFENHHEYTFSYHKKVQLTDGRTEEHNTVKDGQGNTKTMHRRTFGDKSWITTEHSDSTGIKERTEDMINLDESSVEEFKKKWESPSTPLKGEAPLGTVTASQSDRTASNRDSYLSIFKNLFGFIPPH